MLFSRLKKYDYRNKAKMLFGAFPMSLKGRDGFRERYDREVNIEKMRNRKAFPV